MGSPPTSVTIVDNIRWFSPSLPGDFNNNGVVDAADYTVCVINLAALARCQMIMA